MPQTKVNADVTGSVWKLLKQPGDPLEAGEEFMLIESMKMEIPVACESAGRLERVLVAEGDPVTEGQHLATVITE